MICDSAVVNMLCNVILTSRIKTHLSSGKVCFYLLYCQSLSESHLLDSLSLRGVGALDPHHSRHVPAGPLEDLAEGTQVLLLHWHVLLSVSGCELHCLLVRCHHQQRV